MAAKSSVGPDGTVSISEARRLLRERMSEDELQTYVVAMARNRGWLVMHTRPAMDSHGRWKTPLQGHRGFPDLVMARKGRIIFAELKSAKGRVHPDQRRWLDELAAAATPRLYGRLSPEVYVWKPADLDEIERVLT